MHPSSLLATICLSLAACTLSVQAQTIVYNFGTASGTTSPTSDTIDNVTGGTFGSGNRVPDSTATTSTVNASSGYVGASGNFNYALNGIEGGAFNLTTSTYFTLTLTPSAGQAVSLTAFSFGARIANVVETPTSFSIYASDDAFSTSMNLGSGTFTKGSWALYSPTITAFTGDLNSAVTIRVYLYGGNGDSTGGGHNRFDDVTITAQAVPEPSVIAFLALGGLGLIFLKSRQRNRQAVRIQ